MLALIILLSGGVAFALLSVYDIGVAHAQVGSGSAVVDVGSAAGSASAATPAPDQAMVDQLRELHAKYLAMKAAADKDTKMLLWAALLAAGLKILLSIVNMLAGYKPTKWLAWIAMGLAVPIALTSHYALGYSLFDSLIFAGSGPGAVVVHELLKLFGKKPAPAT